VDCKEYPTLGVVFDDNVRTIDELFPDDEAKKI